MPVGFQTICRQVVGWEACDKKTESDHRSLATALELTSAGLLEALGAQDMKQDLAETGLGLAKTKDWLDSVCVKCLRYLLGFMLDTERRHKLALDKLKAIKMPELSNQQAYRKVGLASVGQLADLSKKIEADLKQLTDSRSALSKLKPCKFALDEKKLPAEVVLEEWEKKNGRDPLKPYELELESGMETKVAGFHVAAVAAMCLVGSETVKEGSCESSTLKKLHDIGATLKLKCETLPEGWGKLKKEGETLAEECQRLGKGTKRSAGATDKPGKTGRVDNPEPKVAQHGDKAQAPKEENEEEKAKAKASKLPDGDGSMLEEPTVEKEQKEKGKDKDKKHKKDKSKSKLAKKEKKSKKEHKEKKAKKERETHDKKEKKTKPRDDEDLAEPKLTPKMKAQLWNSPRKNKRPVEETKPEPVAKAKAKAKAKPKAKGKAKANSG